MPFSHQTANGQSLQNLEIWGKLVIFKHVAKGRQGPKGTPGMGDMSYNKIDHIQVIFLHDIQNRAISPLKFPLKTKMTDILLFMGL